MNMSKISTFYSPDGIGLCEEILIEGNKNLGGISLLLNTQVVLYFEPRGVKIDDDWSFVKPEEGKMKYQNVSFKLFYKTLITNIFPTGKL